MCTAATYKTNDFYFGRTLDYESSYGEEIVIMPRNFRLDFLSEGICEKHYAVIGTAHIAGGYPLFYDAVNEKGLCMAGLNFVGNAHYFKNKNGKSNIAQYEFIPWILGKCASTDEAKELISNINITDTPFSFILGKLMKLIHIRDTAKLLILVSVSFLLCTVEDTFGAVVPFSSLVAVMASGITINKIRPEAAERLSARFGRIWVAAEIVLFVLVGAAVDINYAVSAGISAVILIFAVLLFRMAGVAVCLIKTKIPFKQRLFCCLAYLPKATVQAAIGGVPLAMGLSCGNIVLTVAVLSIIITAPLGAFLIDLTYKKLLD